MRGRVGVVIGLDLDDAAADAINQKARSDQFGRHLMDAAGEEAAAEAGRFVHCSGFYLGCFPDDTRMPAIGHCRPSCEMCLAGHTL